MNGAGPSAAGSSPTTVVLEVREELTSGVGCSVTDRRQFRRRTLPRLREEFGPSLRIVWTEPDPGTPALPTFVLDGRVAHSGGYLPWEILRPMVAYSLAITIGVGEMAADAARALAVLDIDPPGIDPWDWQDGLLCWLTRRRDEH